jgi:hypothetical protein
MDPICGGPGGDVVAGQRFGGDLLGDAMNPEVFLDGRHWVLGVLSGVDQIRQPNGKVAMERLAIALPASQSAFGISSTAGSGWMRIVMSAAAGRCPHVVLLTSWRSQLATHHARLLPHLDRQGPAARQDRRCRSTRSRCDLAAGSERFGCAGWSTDP